MEITGKGGTVGPEDDGDSPGIYGAWIEAGLIVLIIFTPLAYGAVRIWSVALFEIIAGLMGFLYIIRTLKLGKLSHILNPADLIFLLIIGYASLQLVAPSIPGLRNLGPRSICPQATKAELLLIISYGLTFFLTLNIVKTKRRVIRVASVVVTVGFLLSLFYLLRYFGIRAPQGFINRDHLAAYLAMVIPLGLGLLFLPSSAKTGFFPSTHHIPRVEQRLLIFFCTLVMGAGLFFTLSRGGMLSLAGAFMVMAVLFRMKRPGRYQKWLLPTTAVGVALMIAWIGRGAVVESVGTIKEEVLSGRLAGRAALWKATVGVVGDFPVFGTGLGTFQYNYISPRFEKLEINPTHWTHAHSDFLELLSETGIPFFLILTAVGLYLLVYLLRRFNSCSAPWSLALSIGLFGSLTSIFIHSFVDFSLKIPANSILLAMEFALLIRLMNLESRTTTFDLKEYVIPRSVNIIIYPLAILLFGLFILAVAKPAIADYYYHQALRQSATRNLQSAIKWDPSNASYHYELGKALAKQPLTANRSRITVLKDALAKYRQAVALDPKCSKYHQSLAWTYGQLADRLYSELKSPGLVKIYLRQAIDEFESAVRLDPDNPYRRRAYAIWLFKHPTGENLKRGVAEYKRAIELEPDLAKEGIKRYYKLQKNFKKLYRVLPGTIETDSVFFEFLLREKGLKFAVDFAEKLLKTYPGNEKVNYLIVKRSSPEKDFSWEFIKGRYNILFEIAPLNPSYRELYGAELYRRGECGEAIANFKMAIELGSNPDTKKLLQDWIERCEKKLLSTTSDTDEKENS